jgi:hypothetical protein
MLEVIDEIPGTLELVKWFGYWPSFHDAEVLDLELHRTGGSTVRIHTFEMTDHGTIPVCRPQWNFRKLSFGNSKCWLSARAPQRAI